MMVNNDSKYIIIVSARQLKCLLLLLHGYSCIARLLCHLLLLPSGYDSSRVTSLPTDEAGKAYIPDILKSVGKYRWIVVVVGNG